MNHSQTLVSAECAVRERLEAVETVSRLGRVTACVGPVIRAKVPEVRIGERCQVRRRVDDGRPVLLTEVVGFDEDKGVILMPLGRTDDVSLDDPVIPMGAGARIPFGEAVVGRVLNGLGEAIDDKGRLANPKWTSLWSSPPNPLRRQRIHEPLATGIRAIDALLTVGRGQRVGIFAPAGAGKSTILSSIARHVDADAVVLALIGERGREVGPFIHDNLGIEGLAKSTVIVSTSDKPALLRLKAAHTATAIAEGLRSSGSRVVLLMDSRPPDFPVLICDGFWGAV